MIGAGCATLTYTKRRAAAVSAAAMHSRAAGKSSASNWAALAGDGRGVPTRWTTTAPRGIAAAIESRASTLPTTLIAPFGAFASDPGRTSVYTRCPRARSAGTVSYTHLTLPTSDLV